MADASAAEPGMIPPPPAQAPHRHSRGAHGAAIALSILATLIGLLVLAWLVLFVTKGRFLKHTFERIASAQSGRQVTIAGDFNLYFDPLATRFLAEGLTVSNPVWATRPSLFSARLIDTRIDTLSLLFGKQRRVQRVNLVNGAIDLEWDRAHRLNSWTFGASDTAGKPFEMPLIRQATIDGTTLRYRDPAMKLSTDIAFQAVDARDNRVDKAIRFTGTGTLRGYPFTLWGAQRSPNQLIATGRNQLELHADGLRTHMDVAGTLPAATQIDGADLTMRVRGRNIRDLFDLMGLAAPDTRDYRLRAHLTKDGNDYRFTKLIGQYGNSDIGGAFTVRVPLVAAAAASDPAARVFITADLRSRLVDLVDIGPFIGYNPQALATKGATAAATTQPAHKRGDVPRILPDAPLRIDAIKTFDAKVTYRIAQIRQPFVPISDIVMGLDLDHALLTLKPLDFDMAGGHVTSTVAINARGRDVLTDYDMRMSPTPMGKLLARFGVAESGTTGTIKARVSLNGRGDTLRKSLATANGRIAVILPRGTFWTSYTQLSEFDIGVFVQRMFQKKLKQPVEINCGLVAFTVRDGIAAADPILIDTSKNVMTARGGFSFRDESLDLLFRADAKKFSLFSGQSPVGIRGYFARPSIQIITPQLLTRVGTSVALGVVATPIASLLAFVDPGDAKAAACGPVLAGADAAAQRTTKGKPRSDVGTGKSADVKKQKDRKFLGIKL